jgi:hypothetical protein
MPCGGDAGYGRHGGVCAQRRRDREQVTK